MSKGKKIGGIILVIIGTIFLVIGLAIGGLFGAMNGAMGEAIDELEQEMDEFRENGVSTYGEIIDIDDESMSTIEYYCEEDGYWYETYIMILNENYRVGSTVEVCYDPYDPTNVMVPELYMDAMGMVGDTVPTVGIVVGVVFGIIGAVLLIVGIVLLVNNKKDKKWTDEINARNAAQGIGNVQYNGYPQQGGMPGGYPQAPGAGGAYQQPGQQNNPYQQNNQNM